MSNEENGRQLEPGQEDGHQMEDAAHQREFDARMQNFDPDMVDIEDDDTFITQQVRNNGLSREALTPYLKQNEQDGDA